MTCHIIDFKTHRRWRLASDEEVNNWIWFYNFEKLFCAGEGVEFTLDKEEWVVVLLREARRRINCGNESIINLSAA